jgi:hypothetical protein
MCVHGSPGRGFGIYGVKGVHKDLTALTVSVSANNALSPHHMTRYGTYPGFQYCDIARLCGPLEAPHYRQTTRIGPPVSAHESRVEVLIERALLARPPGSAGMARARPRWTRSICTCSGELTLSQRQANYIPSVETSWRILIEGRLIIGDSVLQ